jgi:hypothetical protein
VIRRPSAICDEVRTPLTAEEERSLTHGVFAIAPEEHEAFSLALTLLNGVGIPFVVSGLYALHHYTGIYRKTKDLDLLFKPTDVVAAARVLKGGGFQTRLEGRHWLGKAFYGEVMLDLIYGMANGLHLIDSAWYRHSRPSLLAGVPVRVAPPEELILHRLFIGERHRSDSADVVHLLMLRGSELDWPRLIRRVGDHWRLLLAQVLLFDFAYPGRRNEVPDWVREQLLALAQDSIGEVHPDPDVAQGTLVSRFSYAIDVNEWGFKDYRRESVMAARSLPIVSEIAAADVWESVNQEQGLDEEGVATGWGPVPLPTLNDQDAVVDPYTEPLP